MELLQNYYTTSISNNVPVEQEINRINTVIKPEKDEVQSSSTNHIYQNIQNEQPRENIWTIPFLLVRQKIKKSQPPDLEIDFLIDSGVESKMKSKHYTQA